MVTTSITTDAPPERVLGILHDAEMYPRWVVGTRRLVDVEDGWPVPGTSFRHEVGIGPVRVRDRTRMVVDRHDGVVLDARGQPLGRARVAIRVTPESTGSFIELDEVPVSGPAWLVPSLLLDPMTRARNQRSLERLRSIAEARRD